MRFITDKITQLLEHKAFYVVFSIVASIVLWAYVAYVENPEVTVYVSSIPIEFVNEDALGGEKLILTGIDRDSVSINFSGKRSHVTKLTNENLKLTVDLSEIIKNGSVPGRYQLQYSIAFPSNVTKSLISVKSATANYVTATVENLVTAEIPVNCNYDGAVAEGCKAEPIECTPNVITVSGPEAAVSSIHCAFANLRRDVISETVSEQVELVLMDSSGMAVKTDNITLSDSTVNMTIPVVVVKEVALDIKLVYGKSAAEDNVTYTVNPSVITLAGDPELMKDIDTLTLKTVDVNGFASTYSGIVDIVLPDGVENVSGINAAAVTVQIKDTGTAKVFATNIQTKNDTPGYRSEIITQGLEVTVRGRGSTAPAVRPENLRVIADMTELGNSEGVFSVPASVYIDGVSDIDAVGDYKVTVSVTKE